MAPDLSKVDEVLQYALLLAGQEDEYFDRQLGPIHLIKYVYLADLTYARRNNGQTYTGIDWQFYKFGPWSQAVNARIKPALSAIHADMRVFESDFEDRDDWVRWQLRDDHLLDRLERSLPATITMHLRRDVHRYGKDTPELLDYVYKTEPMLHAAPHEHLDFTVVGEGNRLRGDRLPLRVDELSAKKKKKFSERLRKLRTDVQAGQAVRKKKLINPVKSPRHDSIYEHGMAWLDSLAGPEITPGEKVAEFTEEVWKSKTRTSDDFS